MSAELESHFNQFAGHIIGNGTTFTSEYGIVPLVYADWAASGRWYQPLEQQLVEDHGKFIGNPHTESNITGGTSTASYHAARENIRRHIGANEEDVLIMAGSGMTDAVARLQAILGWRIPERFANDVYVAEEDRPVIFISEAEHHSNDISWREQNLADVVLIPGDPSGIVDTLALRSLVQTYKDRRTKVAAITAASNVTGIRPPIHEVAEIMHQQDGLCFVDYTCAAPYDDINMHPSDEAALDAIYFSPHKFLGGPGAPGVLAFNKRLYGDLKAPVQPGGGTVRWTNPWGERSYYGTQDRHDIEDREDGGTPPFIGTIRAALAIDLKEAMGINRMALREDEICEQVFDELRSTEGVHILADEQQARIPIFAMTIDGLHYNAAAKLLNDRYGIQTRGGCACAGTYGHKLFGIDISQSHQITHAIDRGDLSNKPGFLRASFHPTMPSSQISYITQSIAEVASKGPGWIEDYYYDKESNEFSMLPAARQRFGQR